MFLRGLICIFLVLNNLNMLSKKNITRLLNPTKRRTETLKYSLSKRKALMSAEYAGHVIDGQILHRGASLENYKNA